MNYSDLTICQFLKRVLKDLWLAIAISAFTYSSVMANAWDATNFNTRVISSNSVGLTWSAPAESTGLTEYALYRNGSLLASLSPSTYSFTDTTALGETTYTYTLITCYTNIGCQASGIVSVINTPTPTTMSAVTGLTATATTSSIALSWINPSDASSQTEYRVYKGNTLVGTTRSNGFVDSSVTSNTSYTYQVLRCTFNAGCMSDGPRVSSAALKAYPASPSSLTANVFGTNVDLSWTASSDAGLVSEYRVYREGAQIGTSKSTSLADSKLNPNTTYKYAVYACNAQAVCNPNGAQAVAVTENTTVAIPATANAKAVTLAAKLIGEPSKSTLSVKVSIPESSLTSVFVAFLYYGQLTFLNNTNTWVPYVGITPPEYQFLIKTPVELEIPIVKDTDLTPYKGGQLIVGYGKGLTTDVRWNSLLTNATYQIVYELGK